MPSQGIDYLQATSGGISMKKDASYIMVYFSFMTHKYKIKAHINYASGGITQEQELHIFMEILRIQVF